MKDEIRKTGFPSDRISVIPNGCDIELFADNAPRRLELRAQHDWLGDRPLISYVGAIGKINAVDYLVEISGETFALDPEIRFAVIGTGIEEENVRKLAQDRGIYGKTFFMLGAVPKRRAAVWVSASTMTIALVRGPRFIWKDATQNKYFDSLAAGRPVASNYDGWQAQVASDVGAGIILDRDDHRAAARQLLSAVRDTEWLEGAARAAADLANQRYSRDKQAEELERILAETVADHQRRKVPS
jgi:glycosyltransferase involved in cell wall biosynthesis